VKLPPKVEDRMNIEDQMPTYRVGSVCSGSIRLNVCAMRQPLQLSLAQVTGHAGVPLA